MNWATFSVVVGSIASLMAILAFIYKGSKVVASAIKEEKNKNKAERARIETLWAIVQIQGEMIREVQNHLALPPEERESKEFYIRSSMSNLEQQAFERLASHRTDFT